MEDFRFKIEVEGCALRICNQDLRIQSCHTDNYYTCFSLSFVANHAFFSKILNFLLQDDLQLLPGLNMQQHDIKIKHQHVDS